MTTTYLLEATARKITLRIASACDVSSSGDYFVNIQYWKPGGAGGYATHRRFHLNSGRFLSNGPREHYFNAPAYLVNAAKQLIAQSIRAGLPFIEYTRERQKRITTYPSDNPEMRYYTDEFVALYLNRVDGKRITRLCFNCESEEMIRVDKPEPGWKCFTCDTFLPDDQEKERPASSEERS